MIEPFPLTQCKVLSTEAFERLEPEDWVIEPKIDGWRMQMDVTPEGVTAWTRTNHIATGKMPATEAELKKLVGKHTARLDGEAVFIDDLGEPDYNFTARCLGSGIDVCVMKQEERGWLTYFVFDVLSMDGHDVRDKPLEYRKALMWRYLGKDMPLARMILGEEPSFEQHTRNFEQYKEGSVLKDIHAPYAGRRHKSWLKLKEIETVDAQICGYKEGQGKFEGLIGAIQFRATDGTIGFCSGMTDDDRIYISDRQDQLLGKHIEVAHFGKLVDGYRHPQFKGFRKDLDR